MAQQVRMYAPMGGVLQTANSGVLQVPSDGIITVNSGDVTSLLQQGCQFVNVVSDMARISAPRAGTAARIVASAALANGTLAIANQPDFPRQCALRVDPGTTAITAGTTTLVYTANDGLPQTDVISLVTAASTVISTATSKGVLHLTSLTNAAVAGGTSPGIQVNDMNSLSVIVQSGATDFQVLKANVDNADEAVGTVASSAFSIIPTTAPNGTHNYDFVYTFNAPTY